MKGSGIVWTLIALLLVAAIGAYAVVATRRARREQLERSQERAQAMLLAMHEAAAAAKANASKLTQKDAPRAAPPAVQSIAAVPAAAAPAVVAKPEPPAEPIVLTRRAAMLTDPQRLMFLVLRAGLPDHVIMPNLRIIDLLQVPVDASQVERDARLAELARQRADFVVCTAGLEPLAAIVLHDGGTTLAAADQLRVDALREIGVRYLRFRPDNLPKPSEARGFILG